MFSPRMFIFLCDVESAGRPKLDKDAAPLSVLDYAVWYYTNDTEMSGCLHVH